MSIYATNRVGGSSTVVANENYNSNIGRILYESQVNDMAVFEAVVASDLREFEALKEGTILESELSALNEATAKELLSSLQNRVQLFWAKIKAAFKSTMQKIAAYVLKDGKAWVKEFEKRYAKNERDGKNYTGGNRKVEKFFDITKIKIPTTRDCNEAINKGLKSNEELEKKKVVAQELCKSIGIAFDESITAKNFKDKAKDVVFVKKELGIDELKGIVSNVSTVIKGLKNAEKATDKELNKLKSELQHAEREVAVKSGGDPSKTLKRISMLVSCYETIVTATTAMAISGTKTNLKLAKSELSKILSDMTKEESVKAESAAMVAADEVEDALDDTEQLTAEEKEAVDDAIDAVETDD